jgi:hypothetical protein
MIVAVSIKNKVLITITGTGTVRLERLKKGDSNWLVWTNAGFVSVNPETVPLFVGPGDFLDNQGIEDGAYTYRCVPATQENPQKKDYQYANWVRCGNTGPLGYTFGNYTPAPGTWGNALCPDDLRYTYLWGTDFKATNGTLYTDAQIQYFINASVADIERRLNIAITKRRIRCDPDQRNLVQGKDYDEEEGYYDFSYAKIARYGTIVTNQRPIIKLHRLDVLGRSSTATYSLLDSTLVDKTKGVLKMLHRPIRPSPTAAGIGVAIHPYGQETFNPHLFYAIDYDAGYETSDTIPMDLREAIGKNAAISLLNIIGDGIMSGFSSSSLSIDGMSESFSSTQSATSAYFGARIKVYEDEIAGYLEAVSRKFGFMQMGIL